MKTRLHPLIMALVVAVIGPMFLGGALNSASADATAHASNVSVAESSLAASVGSIASASAEAKDAQGRINLAYQVSEPGHWKPKKALKVKFAKSYAAGVRSGKPFRLKKGKKFPDTGLNADGNPLGYNNVVGGPNAKGKWMLFDFDKNGNVHRRGYWNGHEWSGDCYNIKPPVKPTLSWTQVVLNQYLNFTVLLNATLTGSGSGDVAVVCQGSSASSKASANASANGLVAVTIQATSKAGIQGQLNSAEVQAQIKLQLAASLKQNVATALEANASCTDNPPPPPVYNPPSVNANGNCPTPNSSVPPTVTVSFASSNSGDNSATITLGGQTRTVQLSGGTGQTTFDVPANGTYTGTVTVNPSGKSTPFSVSVNCNKPPEENKYVSVTCQTPEEIFVGASYLVQCEVSGNTGQGIAVSASANNGNSRISGVKCLSTGTTVCPATGGSFQFRIEGMSEGSTSFTARASSAGVSATPFVSDPFPVDPQDGGF
jgi:hypothetical protein